MRRLLLVGITMLFGLAQEALAFTANKVWFEFRPNGRFRVTVAYTVPALKEFRENYVEFSRKKEAEQFYWAMVRGADFYPPDSRNIHFQKTPSRADPW